MHFTVHDDSVYLVTTRPDASSRVESFLICASPCTRKSAPCLRVVAARAFVRPGAEAERLDALLQQVLGERRRLRRRIRLIGVAHRDPHRDLRIAARADEFDALVARHLVERLLQRPDVDHRLRRHRHQAVLAELRRALLHDGRDVVSALRQQPVAQHVVVLGERARVEHQPERLLRRAGSSNPPADRTAAAPCRCRSADPFGSTSPTAEMTIVPGFGLRRAAAAGRRRAPRRAGCRRRRRRGDRASCDAGACASFAASPAGRRKAIHRTAPTAITTIAGDDRDRRWPAISSRRRTGHAGVRVAGRAARPRAVCGARRRRAGCAARRIGRGAISVGFGAAAPLRAAPRRGAPRRTPRRSGSARRGAWRAPCARRRPSRPAPAR